MHDTVRPPQLAKQYRESASRGDCILTNYEQKEYRNAAISERITVAYPRDFKDAPE